MIEAGSTGSRIHIYKFNCGASAEYEYEVFKKISYAGKHEEAAKSLDVLFDELYLLLRLIGGYMVFIYSRC